jgi:hypothetical protein
LIYGQLHLDNGIELGKVQFYFRIQIGPDFRDLALIHQYSKPDGQLLEDSYGTVYSVAQLEEEAGLQVVEAKSILSVVAMIPHSHQGEAQWFVWEQMGLDFGLTGMLEIDNDIL